MSHDQNFKNLLLDYPLDALRLFAADEAGDLSDQVQITPIRQEQLKSRLGHRFRELDCPLRVDWPDGRREAILFALEEETEPQRFSIHRLIHYCVDLAELCKTDRIVPVVIFLRPGTYPEQLQLGTRKKTYLDFSYTACHLASWDYTDYYASDNIVARLNLFNMACAQTPRLQIYDQSLRGLFTLEPDPKKREKYVDFIDIYANLSEQERILYEQDYLMEEPQMTSFKEWFRAQGMEQGREQGMEQGREQGMRQGMRQGMKQGMKQGRQQGIADMLLGQLAVKFGQTPSQAVRTRVAQADPDTLRRWSERILSAHSVQEVFASGTQHTTAN